MTSGLGLRVLAYGLTGTTGMRCMWGRGKDTRTISQRRFLKVMLLIKIP